MLKKLTSIIRNSFLNADFCQSIVKILVNPKGFTAFCAAAWQKSAIQKIFDLKVRIFYWIFGGWARRKADAFQGRNTEKTKKRPLSGYFGLYSSTCNGHFRFKGAIILTRPSRSEWVIPVSCRHPETKKVCANRSPAHTKNAKLRFATTQTFGQISQRTPK